MICPGCDSGLIEIIRPYGGKHPVFQRMSLLECGKCSLVFADPQPTPEELKQYYSSYWDGHVAVSTPSTRRYYLAQSVSRVNYLASYFKQDRPMDILDVGAGLGLFAEGLVLCNVKANYFAVEPDHKQFENLKSRLGENCAYRQIDDIPAGLTFDIIVLAHVLEHVRNPHKFIDSLLLFLNPNGLLFIEVPNRDYRYKDDFDSHLFFFNLQSMQAILQEHGEVLDVCTVGKVASTLKIKNTKPQHGLIAMAKEVLKSVIAVASLDMLNKHIERYDMNKYGDDRQWLRALLKKNNEDS